jgi:flagellar biosynthetic protein FliR
MPANVNLPAEALLGFLTVLARMGGAITFVPLPGLKGVPAPARVFFAIVLSAVLLPRWPALDPAGLTAGRLVSVVLGEAAIGIAIGLTTAVVLEVYGMACQILGMQAGYGYASMIDPGTEADSGVLVVMAQLAAGMMFMAAGLDREVLRLFAHMQGNRARFDPAPGRLVPPGIDRNGPGGAPDLVGLMKAGAG